ncbi:hypothetical protein Scep_002482 [Stephania cephalantha]|uniref:Uncharacterized protein n=1 Tax=Stephania cephalantha TaxID=152367 RepID=A0AAP0Q8T9_9MAGN
MSITTPDKIQASPLNRIISKFLSKLLMEAHLSTYYYSLSLSLYYFNTQRGENEITVHFKDEVSLVFYFICRIVLEYPSFTFNEECI